jgi:hypothetical protein
MDSLMLMQQLKHLKQANAVQTSPPTSTNSNVNVNDRVRDMPKTRRKCNLGLLG